MLVPSASGASGLPGASTNSSTSPHLGSSLSRLPLDLCNGFGAFSPSCLDQVFQVRVSCVFQGLDVDVSGSLAEALEQAMRVVELCAEDETEDYVLLFG